MKVLIIGGHLSPAFATINELKKEEIIFVGRKFALEGDKALSLEYILCKEKNIPFVNIVTGRLQRSFTIHTLFSLLKIPLGFFQAFKIIVMHKPDVVVGFGGYVSLPIIFAAFIFRKPVIIHEQTFEAGMANRFPGNFAKKVCISWESSRQFFPKNKTILTGNPLRKEIINNPQKTRNKSPLIYVTGGSLGSHKINVLIEDSLNKLLDTFNIIHQTGGAENYKDYERLLSVKNKLAPEKSSRYSLAKFFNATEASSNLSSADLVIARAGANTVCELFFLEKPCLLLPLSFAQKDEQRKNALFLKDAGLAEIIEDTISATEFADKIKEMFSEIESYKLKKNHAEKDAMKTSALKIAQVIREVVRK